MMLVPLFMATAHASDTTRLSVTAMAGMAAATFPSRGLATQPSCCTTFGDASGVAASIGVGWSTPIANSLSFHVAASGGLFTLGAEAEEAFGLVNIGGQPVEARSRHQLDVTIPRLSAAVGLGWTLWSELSVRGGVGISMPFATSVTQSEVLLTPGAVFEDGTTSRNSLNAVPLPESAPWVTVYGNLGYGIDISPSLRLLPEVGIEVSLGSPSAALPQMRPIMYTVGLSCQAAL
jgi:hypothetical protein